jgi:hypothetical protein
MQNREILQAVELLKDENLVWSNDFNDLKLDLANLLLVMAAQGGLMHTIADNFAKKLIYQGKATSYDLGLERRDA